MKKDTLTGKQQIVLNFIGLFFRQHRCYPLIREVQAGCGITSYKSALDRLNALERKGYLKRVPNKHRGIRLLRKVQRTSLADQETPAASPQVAGVAQ